MLPLPVVEVEVEEEQKLLSEISHASAIFDR